MNKLVDAAIVAALLMINCPAPPRPPTALPSRLLSRPPRWPRIPTATARVHDTACLMAEAGALSARMHLRYWGAVRAFRQQRHSLRGCAFVLHFPAKRRMMVATPKEVRFYEYHGSCPGLPGAGR